MSSSSILSSNAVLIVITFLYGFLLGDVHSENNYANDSYPYRHYGVNYC